LPVRPENRSPEASNSGAQAVIDRAAVEIVVLQGSEVRNVLEDSLSHGLVHLTIPFVQKNFNRKSSKKGANTKT
jgi:hypothetical protein